MCSSFFRVAFVPSYFHVATSSIIKYFICNFRQRLNVINFYFAKRSIFDTWQSPDYAAVDISRPWFNILTGIVQRFLDLTKIGRKIPKK